MSNYDHSIETGHLGRIAFQDYVGARILWNLGVFMPSLHLVHESIEKYLKVLWANGKVFIDEKDLEKKLKKFNHDFNKIFGALDSAHQTRLNQVMQKNGFKLYHLEGLRYGTRQVGVMYSDALFKSAELFIKEVRLILGEKVKRNILEELKKGVYPLNYKQEIKRNSIYKSILDLKRVNPSKKERKKMLREFYYHISRVIGN